ncbi:MAG: hypothetical protein ACJASM_002038 [Salibacteraceae bacterium]|jgi:hypothetical protein
MAKVEIKFIDDTFNSDFIQVICFKQENKSDIISIQGDCFGQDFVIHLDKSTAIRFAKTLRTEINKIQD